MKTRIYIPVAATVLALLLAGCKFQALTRLEPDGSGALRTEVGFRAEERQNLENQSGSEASEDFCNTAGAPAGAVVTEEQRGDETWCVTVTTFDDLDGLRRLYQQNTGLHINRLEIADGMFYYDVDIDTSSDDSNFSVFESITWTVSLPGAPLDHNARRAEGNSLTWELSPRTGTINLRAASRAEQAGSVLPGIAAALGLAALIGLAVWRLRAARKPSERIMSARVTR